MTLIDEIEQRIHSLEITGISITDEEIAQLSHEEIHSLQHRHGAHVLLKVPERERQFFEWLKLHDYPVWKELWEQDEDMFVSLAFLENFKKEANGFLICDLEDQDNYFFTHRHIKPEGRAGIRMILKKAERGEQLAIGEALMFEVSMAPIDIWHFCYKYSVQVEKAKQIVADLYRHDWLVHLPKSEDLTSYLEEPEE